MMEWNNKIVPTKTLYIQVNKTESETEFQLPKHVHCTQQRIILSAC